MTGGRALAYQIVVLREFGKRPSSPATQTKRCYDCVATPVKRREHDKVYATLAEARAAREAKSFEIENGLLAVLWLELFIAFKCENPTCSVKQACYDEPTYYRCCAQLVYVRRNGRRVRGYRIFIEASRQIRCVPAPYDWPPDVEPPHEELQPCLPDPPPPPPAPPPKPPLPDIAARRAAKRKAELSAKNLRKKTTKETPHKQAGKKPPPKKATTKAPRKRTAKKASH
jgi:hypothetical protein